MMITSITSNIQNPGIEETHTRAINVCCLFRMTQFDFCTNSNSLKTVYLLKENAMSPTAPKLPPSPSL